MKRYEVRFQYADAMSNWEWREQACSVYATDAYDATIKCRNLYALGYDCDYSIISVKEDQL